LTLPPGEGSSVQGMATTLGRQRAIGPLGTAARVLVALVCFGAVLASQLFNGIQPASLALGLVGFPAVLLALQWLRSRRDPTRFEATSPAAAVLNGLVFLALFLTPWYARPLAVTSDAALLFYGASMLLAALRGYGGCEVLAFSNWVLRRDDQVGCFLFGPLDHLERRR
jgi:hypothetical protein